METIYWFVLNANDLPPSETYFPVQRYNEDTFGCPQMVKYNQHRAYNKKNNCSYKSLKITIDSDDSLILACSNWENKNEK